MINMAHDYFHYWLWQQIAKQIEKQQWKERLYNKKLIAAQMINIFMKKHINNNSSQIFSFNY